MYKHCLKDKAPLGSFSEYLATYLTKTAELRSLHGLRLQKTTSWKMYLCDLEASTNFTYKQDGTKETIHKNVTPSKIPALNTDFTH